MYTPIYYPNFRSYKFPFSVSAFSMSYCIIVSQQIAVKDIVIASTVPLSILIRFALLKLPKQQSPVIAFGKKVETYRKMLVHANKQLMKDQE